jgi:orotidine-5'-phosphate decarboxylase
MTPRAAIEAGADFVVIGRPITQSFSNGAAAMRERAIEIAEQILQ